MIFLPINLKYIKTILAGLIFQILPEILFYLDGSLVLLPLHVFTNIYLFLYNGITPNYVNNSNDPDTLIINNLCITLLPMTQ